MKLKPVKLEDIELDPRKFDGDMLEESWGRTTDDECFEGIYGSGLTVPEHSADYPAWVMWLAKNHPKA